MTRKYYPLIFININAIHIKKQIKYKTTPPHKNSSLINSKSDRIMCRNKYDSFIATGKNMT